MELAARQRVEEQVVELMKEGYDKQRAEAELNFQKEKQRIDKEEQERLALYDKLKAAGAKVFFGRPDNDHGTGCSTASAGCAVAGQQAGGDRTGRKRRRTAKSSRSSSDSIRTTRRKREAIERKYNEDISARPAIPTWRRL